MSVVKPQWSALNVSRCNVVEVVEVRLQQTIKRQSLKRSVATGQDPSGRL